MHSRLASYQEMRELSARMVEAAHADDWEHLAELEKQVAALRDSLATNPETVSATQEELARQARLMQDILADHEEVARCTQPKLDEMRALLGDAAVRRRLDLAYDIEES